MKTGMIAGILLGICLSAGLAHSEEPGNSQQSYTEHKQELTIPVELLRQAAGRQIAALMAAHSHLMQAGKPELAKLVEAQIEKIQNAQPEQFRVAVESHLSTPDSARGETRGQSTSSRTVNSLITMQTELKNLNRKVEMLEKKLRIVESKLAEKEESQK